jgi:hypothetical protein
MEKKTLKQYDIVPLLRPDGKAYEKHSKKYRRKSTEISYYTEDVIDELEKNIDVIGAVKIRFRDEKNDGVALLRLHHKDQVHISLVDVYKRESGRFLGYIHVGNNQFIELYKRRIFPLIILLFILVCGGVFVASSLAVPLLRQEEPELRHIEEGEKWDGEYPVNGDMSKANSEEIEIPGYSELYVSDEEPKLTLINPIGNSVYFEYVLTDQAGNELYGTDLIAPGKVVKWNAKSDLNSGDHNVKIQINTYDIKTQSRCSGAEQSIVLHVY